MALNASNPPLPQDYWGNIPNPTQVPVHVSVDWEEWEDINWLPIFSNPAPEIPTPHSFPPAMLSKLPGELRNKIYESYLQVQAKIHGAKRSRGCQIFTDEQQKAYMDLARALGPPFKRELETYVVRTRSACKAIWEVSWPEDLVDLWTLQSSSAHRGRVYSGLVNKEYDVVHSGVVGFQGVQDFLDSITSSSVLPRYSAFRRKKPVSILNMTYIPNGREVRDTFGHIIDLGRWTDVPNVKVVNTTYTSDGMLVYWWECPLVKDIYWVWAWATESNTEYEVVQRFRKFHERNLELVERENMEYALGTWPWRDFYNEDGGRKECLIPAEEREDRFTWLIEEID
jgi:hypothetical protein